jgi:shikimate kinase
VSRVKKAAEAESISIGPFKWSLDNLDTTRTLRLPEELWKDDKRQFQSALHERQRRRIMTNQPIVIIGFMGTGKTTVAFELARKLNCCAIDLDELITQHEKRNPQEIILQDGEDAFRSIESKTLRTVLREGSARVVAVGGGAWTIRENRKMIAKHRAFTVWLDAPFELCWKRIDAGREGRPLARSRAMTQKLYAERRPIYEAADARVSVSENESVQKIATKVARAVLQQNANS